jgi:hypothetical protein
MVEERGGGSSSKGPVIVAQARMLGVTVGGRVQSQPQESNSVALRRLLWVFQSNKRGGMGDVEEVGGRALWTAGSVAYK